MIGCGPSSGCCGSCAGARPAIAAPVSLGGLGFWEEIFQFAVDHGKDIAQTVAVAKSLDSNGNQVASASAADQAAAIVSAQRAQSSLPAILKSPAALAGMGALALALLLRR